LYGLGVGKDDEVITQSHTFVATAEAALELGAEPVTTEVNESLNMDPDDLEAKISEETAAVVPVHMYGISAEMERITNIANAHGVPVLEDAAWGLGSTYQGEPLGTIGDVGAYSLNFGKTITTGEGGVLATDYDDIYQAARSYQNHGHNYHPDLPAGSDTRGDWGFNYKTHDLAAAVGLAQLEKLDTVIEHQRENKTRLEKRIDDLDVTVRTRPNPEGESGRGLGLIMDSREQAEALEERLSEDNFGTLNLPNALDWHFAGTWDHIYDAPADGDLTERWPQSNKILRSTVVLPMTVEMDEDTLDAMTDAVREVVA
jgi:8-amino-3,8-dideoxy-alpha-D-manno-octulosonate transaminase